MRSPLTIAFLLLLLSLLPFLHAQLVVEEVPFDDPLVQARSNVSLEYPPQTTIAPQTHEFVTGTGFENGVDCSVKTTFPDSAVNTVGMFFNGRTSRVDVSIHNMEPQKITVNFIGGYFQDIATLKPVVNLTSKAYNSVIQPNGQQVFPYGIQTYFPGPRDQEVYQTVAYNGTVTIADPPQSIFDPQAWFLYIILASVLGAAAYFVYSTWLKTVLPKKTKSRNRDVRKREKPVVVSGTASNYEEWIPQHHLKKESTPAKKRESTPAGKKRKSAKATSGSSSN